MRSIPRPCTIRPIRRGLSFLEFLGCLVAMIGGVFLGSVYLGIDMKTMAVGVLAKADVVSPEFFKADKGATNNPTSLNTMQDLTRSSTTGEAVGVVEEEHVADVKEPAQIEEPSGDNLDSLIAPEVSDAERLAATRAYWDALTECVLHEARNRSKGFQTDEEWQLYDYLTSRKEGHSLALETLKQLNEFGVDERLLSHGRQVATWNSSAVRLFERAIFLLTDGPSAGISGPFAQNWQSSATQLRMEESLIHDKHRAVANYLDHEYADIAPFDPAFKK